LTTRRNARSRAKLTASHFESYEKAFEDRDRDIKVVIEVSRG
jgi:hypothetical protein